MRSWLRVPVEAKSSANGRGWEGELNSNGLYFYWTRTLNFLYTPLPWLLVQGYPRESKV